MTCRHLDVPATPTMLRLAPQLAVLAVLDEAITSSVAALFAQHPELIHLPDNSSSSEPSHARRLHDSLARTSHLLADYRLAIAAMLDELDLLARPPSADYDF